MSNSIRSEWEPIAPMMRVLWQEARDRIHAAFADGEFSDVRAEHLAVLQYPGPDGQRPSTLATRAGMSRQAINHLLRHLERAGYLERHSDPEAHNGRLIRLTDRGYLLMEYIWATAAALEQEWANDLGQQRLEELRATIADLRNSRQSRSRTP